MTAVGQLSNVHDRQLLPDHRPCGLDCEWASCDRQRPTRCCRSRASVLGKLMKKGLHLGRAHLPRVALTVSENEPANPGHADRLDAQTVAFAPQVTPNFVKQPRCGRAFSTTRYHRGLRGIRHSASVREICATASRAFEPPPRGANDVFV